MSENEKPVAEWMRKAAKAWWNRPGPIDCDPKWLLLAETIAAHAPKQEPFNPVERILQHTKSMTYVEREAMIQEVMKELHASRLAHAPKPSLKALQAARLGAARVIGCMGCGGTGTTQTLVEVLLPIIQQAIHNGTWPSCEGVSYADFKPDLTDEERERIERRRDQDEKDLATMKAWDAFKLKRNLEVDDLKAEVKRLSALVESHAASNAELISDLRDAKDDLECRHSAGVTHKANFCPFCEVERLTTLLDQITKAYETGRIAAVDIAINRAVDVIRKLRKEASDKT